MAHDSDDRWLLAPGGSTRLHLAAPGTDSSVCGIKLSPGRTERVTEVGLFTGLKSCKRCMRAYLKEGDRAESVPPSAE